MKSQAGLVATWTQIPPLVRKSIRGLSNNELDRRGGSEQWSIRETVHHIVEANIVASNMIIAALATNGCDFDWTWVNPNRQWMRRVGYDSADIHSALNALRALCDYVAVLLNGQRGTLSRTVKLNDSPGAARYVMTVEQILKQEIEHAQGHVAEIQATRDAD